MNTHIRVLIVTLTLFSTTVLGAWGDYDTTFGSLGIAEDPIASHYPVSLAVQPDGKILVTGYRVVSGNRRFFLRRYLSNGQVDTSFGNNGSAISNALISTEAWYWGQKIVVQANGRIAVLGTGNNIPSIWRFTASGNSDSSIGYGGMKQLTGFSSVYAMSIATHANILYVGLTKGSPAVPIIIKFNADGSRDMSFGSSGELVPGSAATFTAKVEAGTGNILVGGKKPLSSAYGIERFLPTGQLDTSFNHYTTTYEEEPATGPTPFIQLLDGRFVMNEVWYSLNPLTPNTMGSNLVRFASDGSYQGRTNYVPSGIQPFQAGSCPNILDQQSNGRIIARGVHSDKLHRFSTSFSTINTMTCDSYAPIASKTHAILQADGKMIVAGSYNGNMAIVRTVP